MANNPETKAEAAAAAKVEAAAETKRAAAAKEEPTLKWNSVVRPRDSKSGDWEFHYTDARRGPRKVLISPDSDCLT